MRTPHGIQVLSHGVQRRLVGREEHHDAFAVDLLRGPYWRVQLRHVAARTISHFYEERDRNGVNFAVIR